MGNFIDYRYIVKEDMVVAYAVVYKSNFAEEWETAKKLFKDGKLTTSYEIWSDKNKRKELEDGTYELHDMTIAGGAILFKTKPAFEDAKVLEIAKSQTEQTEELVYASEDIIVAKDETVATVPPTEAPKVEEKKPEIVKIKCANCGYEFQKPGTPTPEIKCQECFAIINDSGELLYPPQIIDFNISCPSCSSRNWRLLKREDASAQIKCLSCAKKYGIEFAKIEASELLNMVQFLHVGSISCKQCGTMITYSGSSKMKKYNLTCPKCKLQFSHDITHEQIKKLTKIEELVASETIKASEEIPSQADELKTDNSAIKSEVAKGETEMSVEKKEEVVEQKPTEASVEPKPVEEAPKVEAKAETTPEAKSEVAEVKPETPSEEAKVETPVEVKAEEKPTEAKIEEKVEAPVEAPKVEEKPVEAKEEPKEDETLKKYKLAIRKFAKKIKEMKKEKASISKASEDKVAFYKANYGEISKRRTELGTVADKVSDEEIMEEAKFVDLKLEKANTEAKENVVIASKETTEDWYANKRREITDKAEGRISRKR